MAAISPGEARSRLRDLLLATVRTGTITLASGRTTDFYIDGRLVTLSPEGLLLVSTLILDRIRDRADAIGGPSAGADPMVAGVGILARQHQVPLKIFFTRKEAKGHGMQRRIEGPALAPGDRVLLVDDVATSGGSLIQAASVVREDTQAELIGALVIVDREEGATEKLAGEGVEFQSLFTRTELLGR